MIKKKLLILFCVFISISYLYSNNKSSYFVENPKLNFQKQFGIVGKSSKTIYSFDKAYFHYQIGLQMGGLKFLNIGNNNQIYFQQSRFFSITGGMDFQYFRLKIFSSSDKHIIETGAMPLYFGGLINLKNKLNEPKAYYIFGKKGIAYGFAAENASANNHSFFELGVGQTIKGSYNVSYRFEASYQDYGLSGKAVSSYQSEIEYNLRYRSIILRAALVIHSNRK